MIVDAIIWLWTAMFFVSPIGKCDPVNGPKVEYSAADRAEYYARIRASSIAHGESPITQAYWDAVTERESHGRGAVRHTKGERENGLGGLGLGYIHHKKWPGPWDDMCTPEYAHATARVIAQIAIDKYGAKNILDIQAVYAGRMGCVGRTGDCPGWQQDMTSKICPRMAKRKFSCTTPITAKDFGVRVPYSERKLFAERVKAAR